MSLTLADNTLVPIKSISPVAKQETDPKNIYDFVGEVEVKDVKSLTGAKIEVRANIGRSVSTFSTSYIEDKEYPDNKRAEKYPSARLATENKRGEQINYNHCRD